MLTTENGNIKPEDEEEKNRIREYLSFFNESDYPVLDDDMLLLLEVKLCEKQSSSIFIAFYIYFKQIILF